MMYWNVGGGWAWLLMIPTALIMWAAIALLILPWMRSGRNRPRPPIDLLEERFTAGEISVDEFREWRAELDNRSAG